MIEHKTHSILDSSKIEEYMACPRRYFYRYILGWRREGKDTHLHFGTCWHLAMEYLLTHGYFYETVIDAWNILNNAYREEFPEETDIDRFPKVPGVALKALAGYVKKWADSDAKNKVLYTEIAGSVSLLKNKKVYFKMDSILQDERGQYFSLEHKTGTTNSRQWQDKWKQSIQVGTYSHVLFCSYPIEEVWGIKINGTFFKKGRQQQGDFDFERVPVRKMPWTMEDWLFTVMHWVDEIERDMNRLSYITDNHSIMSAFTKNPGSCTDYFGCPYIDFCLAWPNPIQHELDVPMGFEVEWWNPLAEQEKAKKIVDV